MIKIKDNIPLEELEKYGFRGKETKSEFKDFYRPTRPNEEYFLIVDNNSYEIICYKGKVNARIDLWIFAPFEKIELKEEYIKDLIKADLIEKVEG